MLLDQKEIIYQVVSFFTGKNIFCLLRPNFKNSVWSGMTRDGAEHLQNVADVDVEIAEKLEHYERVILAIHNYRFYKTQYLYSKALLAR